MPQETQFVAMAGCVLLGLILGIALFPKVLRWAERTFPRFRDGDCALCGQRAYVTECGRCGRAVAYCHYYGVLGTDAPDRQNPFRKRRSAQLCTECLAPAETAALEALLQAGKARK